MMAHKQFLHELLKEDQHPFQLKSYIADKRSRYNDFSPTINRRNSCFDSPATKSPGGAASLHVPAETAAVLAEAAMRINKPNLKTQIRNARFSLFGSLLNMLRSKSKEVLRDHEKGKLVEDARVNSCSCSNHSEDFASRFCSTPVRFSIRRSSPSSSGRRTPDCCSPAAPIPMKQEKENYRSGEDSDIVNGEGEEEGEKEEQCSPVSILDPFFEDEIVDAEKEEDDEEDDLNCSFANIERATQQLLNRLRRFEKLAALDPMELELKLLEDSDNNEFLIEDGKSSEDEGQGSNILILPRNRRNMSCETKRFTFEQIVEEKNKTILSHKMDEHGAVYMMAKLDLKRELEGWENIREEVEEKATEVEQEIFRVLVEELSDELLSGRFGS